MSFLVYGVAGLCLLGLSAFIFRKKIKDSPGVKKEKSPPLVSLDEALLKTRENFWEKLKKSFSKSSVIDENEVEKLEEILYTSDLGPKTVNHLMNRLRERLKKENKEKTDKYRSGSDLKKKADFPDSGSINGGSSLNEPDSTSPTTQSKPSFQSSENKKNTGLEDIRLLLKAELNALFDSSFGVTSGFPLNRSDPALPPDQSEKPIPTDRSKNQILELKKQQKPAVWMVIGVNGAGKTTSIGKLASQRVKLGDRVLIGAGDTFRAGADKQLENWSQRAGAEFFSPGDLKDPSALAFSAVKKAVSKDFDLVLIDTAGRLHTQKNLMEELKKIKRVVGKALEGSPHETLLVLDANSGQNALMQTEQFHKALGVSGIILTKMDSSAKGGVAVGIAWEYKIPIKMIGVGEKIQDLRPFQSGEFIDSIL